MTVMSFMRLLEKFDKELRPLMNPMRRYLYIPGTWIMRTPKLHFHRSFSLRNYVLKKYFYISKKKIKD